MNNNSVGVARIEALESLRRVRQGLAVSEAIGHDKGQRAALSSVDRALMAQIVYGVLRHRRYLDAWISPYKRGALEPDIEDILRMAFFQLGFLDRIPAYAIVNAAVEQTKMVQPKAANMVNAILRRGKDYRPRDLSLAEEHSHPDWIVNRWAKRFGPRLENILRENNRIPPLTLRVNLSRADRQEVLNRLTEMGVEAEASPYLPEAIRVTGSLWLEDFPPFADGQVTVQDESSMLVRWILDPQFGDRVIDLAAGLGGKTTHLAETLADQGEFVAVDLSKQRLGLLQENLRRLHLSPRMTLEQRDARKLTGRFRRLFDKVLLDAPCSGLGVLRRRVDARWKKQEGDLSNLHVLQTELMKAAVELAKPGGVIVYSTCSIEPEETVDVVREALHRWPGLSLESVQPFLPHDALKQFVEDGMLTLVPGDLGMDGFFIARLRWREGND